MSDKLTAIVRTDQHWEYRCRNCGQLRLSLGNQEPEKCNNCGSECINVGRPGTLPNDR